MTTVYYIIAILLLSLVLGYLGRRIGQGINWSKKSQREYFRDMPLTVAFGYALGLILLGLAIWYYLQPAEVNNAPVAGVQFWRWAVNGFVIFAIMAFLFRLLGRAVGTQGSRKLFRQMPLTASFGIFIILSYAFVALFAGQVGLQSIFTVAIVGLILSWLAYQFASRDTYRSIFVGTIALTGLFVFMALIVGPLAPYGESEIFEKINVLPGGDPALGGDERFILGTDQLGRDLLSRLIYGARNTVGIAFITTCIAFLLGATFGFLSAILGGWFDQIVSRIVDVLMAIPALIFALLLMTIASAWAGSNGFLLTVYMVIIIAVIDSTRVYRLARAVGQNIVVMDYIEAAKLRGESLTYLVFREVLPNATAPLLAEFGLRFCFVFLTIAALSFLGVGIQPPAADWGTMVRDLSQFVNFAGFSPLTAALPLMAAGAIALLTVAVNFVVDWMLHRSSGLKE